MASITVFYEGREQFTVELNRPSMVLGRDSACDISIDNLSLSRRHCEFRREGSTYILTDLQSKNGTFVNRKEIGEHFLNHGDEIIICKHTLKFNNKQQKGSTEIRNAAHPPFTGKNSDETYKMRVQASRSGDVEDTFKLDVMGRRNAQDAANSGEPQKKGDGHITDFVKVIDMDKPPPAYGGTMVLLVALIVGLAASMAVIIYLLTRK